MGEPTTPGQLGAKEHVVSARWAAGIACVEIRHDRPSQKRVYLRLELDEAKHLRDEIAAVIEEREAWIEHITPECDHEPIQTYNDGSFWCAKCDREVRP